jgi:prepilin-type N-terminal cleavage/methylation domain-containing protein
MTPTGFSLIELLIVIAIIAIASSLATFGFNSYQVKSRVEGQIRQIASDISELRIRALTTKQRHSIVLYPSYYVLKSYSTETYTTDDELIANGTPLFGGNRTVSFPLKNKYTDVVPVAGTPIEINPRGMTSDVVTIFLGNGASSGQAAFNCLKIHTVRVNVGKQNDTTKACDDI